MNNENEYKEKMENLKKYAKENYVPILQDKSLELIETILELKKPMSILEIGTAIGYSAINFSTHLASGGKITTVELNPETAELAKKNIKDFGKEEVVEVVVGDGEQEMQRLVKEGKIFDAVFIDAAKGQYVKYLDLAIKLTRPSSVIIADNVLFKGRVLSDYNEHKHRTAVNRLREYLKDVTENIALQTTVLDVGDGVAISVVKGWNILWLCDIIWAKTE